MTMHASSGCHDCHTGKTGVGRSALADSEEDEDAVAAAAAVAVAAGVAAEKGPIQHILKQQEQVLGARRRLPLREA